MPQLQWNPVTNPNPNIETPLVPYGPFQLPQLDSAEFSPVQYIQTSISSVMANANRLISSQKDIAAPQAQGRPWYDLFGRIGDSASAVNDAFQSTLVKIIVLVAIVGVVGVFGMSYLQAKGANLAK